MIYSQPYWRKTEHVAITVRWALNGQGSCRCVTRLLPSLLPKSKHQTKLEPDTTTSISLWQQTLIILCLWGLFVKGQVHLVSQPRLAIGSFLSSTSVNTLLLMLPHIPACLSSHSASQTLGDHCSPCPRWCSRWGKGHREWWTVSVLMKLLLSQRRSEKAESEMGWKANQDEGQHVKSTWNEATSGVGG